MTYTPEQLKRALAKMLPEKCGWLDTIGLIHIVLCEVTINGVRARIFKEPVLDNQILDLCYQVEETLSLFEFDKYQYELSSLIFDVENPGRCQWVLHAYWDKRIPALAKVKGIEIL